MVVENKNREYEIKIFDWDFGFSTQFCVPPDNYRKNWCGDGHGCYHERDYWDVLRFITSMGLTITQLEKIFPGSPLLKMLRKLDVQGRDMISDLDDLSQIYLPDSVQELLDSFNPLYIPNTDSATVHSVRLTFDEVHTMITKPLVETFNLTRDARKILTSIFNHVVTHVPDRPFSKDDTLMLKFRTFRSERPDLPEGDCYVLFVMTNVYEASNEQLIEEGGYRITPQVIKRSLQSDILSYKGIKNRFFEVIPRHIVDS